MNITPQNITLPLATVVNPQTDALRRENNQREVIAQPAAASQSASEKGVSSDKDRARSPNQQNDAVDFAKLQKQSEQDNKTISDEQSSHQESSHSDEHNTAQNSSADENSADEATQNTQSDKTLDFSEQQKVTELKRRDAEVRTHEHAHAATGGATTGTPSFSYEVGPDGKRYVVDGEVSVDLSPVEGNPQATIAKMQKVYSAALAPANPSVQDTRVANSAAQFIAQAQSELLAMELGDPNKAKETNRVDGGSSFVANTNDTDANEESQNFDSFVNNTLNAQDNIAPTRAEDVNQRAGRIEHFYADINHAYEKAPTSRFQLTA